MHALCIYICDDNTSRSKFQKWNKLQICELALSCRHVSPWQLVILQIFVCNHKQRRQTQRYTCLYSPLETESLVIAISRNMVVVKHQLFSQPLLRSNAVPRAVDYVFGSARSHQSWFCCSVYAQHKHIIFSLVSRLSCECVRYLFTTSNIQRVWLDLASVTY